MPTDTASTPPEQRRCPMCKLGVASQPDPCPFREQIVKVGECLAVPAGSAGWVWYLRQGWVMVSSTEASGAELSCAVRGPGSMLGLESLAGATFPFELWTLSPVVLCKLAADAFQDWLGWRNLRADTVLGCAVDELAQRASDRQALSGNAPARVARFLERMVPQPEGDEQRLRIPARVIARVLSMRAETLSRALSQLRAAGALEAGRAIVVADREQLGRFAAGN